MALPNLSFQPYVTPYSGAPVKEFSDLTNTLNQRYDENIAKYDRLDELVNQLQVRDIDNPIKDSLKQDTRAAISNVSTNGDWENAKVPIREIARRFSNDPAISRAVANRAAEQKLDEQRLQAAIAGRPLIQFQDYKNFSTQDPITGKLRDLPMDGVYEGKLDNLQKMREVFADVSPDSFAYKNSQPAQDEATGAIYQVGSGASKRYLTKDKIQQVVDRSFGNFLNTAEGQQRLKVLTTKNSENAVPLDQTTALNQIKRELLSTGLNKTFSDISTESSTKLPASGKGKQKDPFGDYRLTKDNSYQQNQDLSGLINSLEKPSVLDKSLSYLGSSRFKGLGIESDEASYKQGLIKAIPDNMKSTYNSLDKVFASVTDPDKRKSAIVNYLKNVQNGKIEPKYMAYNGTERINAENNFIKNGNVDGRVFLDPETHKVLTWQQIKDEYKNEAGKKITDKDLDDSKLSGEYLPDNPFVEMSGNIRFASPQKFSVGGHKFVLGSDEQEVSSPNFVLKTLENGITKATRTGLPVTFKGLNSNDNGLKIIPKDNGYLIQDQKGQLRGLKGSGGDITPLSLEDAKAILYSTGNIINQ